MMAEINTMTRMTVTWWAWVEEEEGLLSGDHDYAEHGVFGLLIWTRLTARKSKEGKKRGNKRMYEKHRDTLDLSLAGKNTFKMRAVIKFDRQQEIVTQPLLSGTSRIESLNPSIHKHPKPQRSFLFYNWFYLYLFPEIYYLSDPRNKTKYRVCLCVCVHSHFYILSGTYLRGTSKASRN